MFYARLELFFCRFSVAIIGTSLGTPNGTSLYKQPNKKQYGFTQTQEQYMVCGLPHDFNPVSPRHEPEQQDELPLCA